MPNALQLQNERFYLNGVRKYKALLLDPGQSTVFAARDGADIRAGIAKPTANYQVETAASQSGTTAVYLPTLARNDIAFVNGTSKITAAAGLDGVKTGDVIRIRGSALNETEFTVSTGNVATEIVTSVAPTEEVAGAYITIAKQALQSNNVVRDMETGLDLLRYGSYSPAKLGAASDGKLLWTATAVSVHAANTDLKVTTGGKGRATYTINAGAGEVLRYWAGYSYSFTVFANANAKLPGFRCISVTVNGADLDLLMDTGNITVATEAGPINGVINLSVNDIWSFANACIHAAVGGYSDWRVPNRFELASLMDGESPTGYPNSVAFPSMGAIIWTSSTDPADVSAAATANWTDALLYAYAKTTGTLMYAMLLRGGI